MKRKKLPTSLLSVAFGGIAVEMLIPGMTTLIVDNIRIIERGDSTLVIYPCGTRRIVSRNWSYVEASMASIDHEDRMLYEGGQALTSSF